VKAAWARPEKGPGGTATEQARAGFAGLGTALPSQILDEAAGNTLSRHPLEHREVLEGRITASADFHWCMPGLTATCILATRVGFVLLGRQLVRTTRGRELAGKRAEDENQRKENANVRLMNEMGALADGDLTTKATVSEGITGAIADSVNLTMGELRKVGDSVELMSQSIGAVSKSAGVVAAVARQSLMTAERGSLAVQNSVNSMNHIRDRIQETSKRIKRLGGSTQEIGEIVGLISGITEQHNVLALNEAIQAGTQDAVAAMERSTHGVVKGTQRSDAAGSALSEIDTVTNELAERIQNIAVSTKMQVDIALKAAKSMHNSLTFTREATMGTNETAATIRQLAARARQLKPSVSRFQV
jgi:twitching motility protein PilJ